MSEYHAPSRRALLAGGALAATAAGVSAFSPAHAEQANKPEEFMTSHTLVLQGVAPSIILRRTAFTLMFWITV